VHVQAVVMFDISVRTAILRYCFWYSLFHFMDQLVKRWKWRTRRSRQKSVRQLQSASMCKQGALHHHLQVCA